VSHPVTFELTIVNMGRTDDSTSVRVACGMGGGESESMLCNGDFSSTAAGRHTR